MMERIKPLPNWVLTGTRPAFYDSESATAVEQTAKVYAAIRELQDDYNKYVSELNQAIDEFVNGVNTDQEEFKNHITEIMHNYITMIDEKIKTQDKNIADAVAYMKTNIIDSANQTIKEMVASGEIDHDTYFNSVADMKESTVLMDGDVVQTLGYYSANDGGAGMYKIRSKQDTDIEDSGSIHFIGDNLVAELINENSVNMMQRRGQTHFQVKGNALIGDCKGGSILEQSPDKDSVIDVQYNNGLVEKIQIKNTGRYPNKTAINVLDPAQRLRFNNIYMDSGFKTGMKIPRGFYSQFNDVWFEGETGVDVGNPDNPSQWIGVLDFNACHFDRGKIGFRQNAIDTNTICVDKCCFEHNEVGIDNNGTMYVRNTYFGDTPTESTNKINTLVARPGSDTRFRDCSIGISNVDNGELNTIFDLKSNDDKGSVVHVEGGLLAISNNGLSGKSAIYDSDSDKNIIYIDHVKFTPSTNNKNHNQFPFYLKSFTPLRSLNPIKNYVINGTMKNQLMNSILMNTHSPDKGNFVEDLVNPFGGKVAEYNKTQDTVDAQSVGKAFIFNYKIPSKLLNKKMILELYAYDGTNNNIRISSSGLGLSYYYPGMSIEGVNDANLPRIKRMEVTPTSLTGTIRIELGWSALGVMRIAGVILKEYEEKDYLSCYEDQDIMANPTIPTTDGAIKGDIVYNIADNPTCLGWIYNGTSWVEYNSY